MRSMTSVITTFGATGGGGTWTSSTFRTHTSTPSCVVHVLTITTSSHQQITGGAYFWVTTQDHIPLSSITGTIFFVIHSQICTSPHDISDTHESLYVISLCHLRAPTSHSVSLVTILWVTHLPLTALSLPSQGRLGQILPSPSFLSSL